MDQTVHEWQHKQGSMWLSTFQVYSLHFPCALSGPMAMEHLATQHMLQDMKALNTVA